MVDLHSHILPAVDDGPSRSGESVRLVRMEIANGVNTIALTPHFSFEKEGIEAFSKRRAESMKKLQSALRRARLSVHLVEAAEVFLSPQLLDDDRCRTLCYAGTAYMLVELPFQVFPDWVPDVLYELRQKEIVPIIAHVERYTAVLQKPELLYDLIGCGALTQVNADSLVMGDRHMRSLLFHWMQLHLVHLLATDAHSIDHRPPLLRTAMELVVDKMGESMALRLDRNSRMIIQDGIPDLPEPIRP